MSPELTVASIIAWGLTFVVYGIAVAGAERGRRVAGRPPVWTWPAYAVGWAIFSAGALVFLYLLAAPIIYFVSELGG